MNEYVAGRGLGEMPVSDAVLDLEAASGLVIFAAPHGRRQPEAVRAPTVS
jgi:hypothetical protein